MTSGSGIRDGKLSTKPVTVEDLNVNDQPIRDGKVVAAVVIVGVVTAAVAVAVAVAVMVLRSVSEVSQRFTIMILRVSLLEGVVVEVRVRKAHNKILRVSLLVSVVV